MMYKYYFIRATSYDSQGKEIQKHWKVVGIPFWKNPIKMLTDFVYDNTEHFGGSVMIDMFRRV